ncbi:MAG: histidinol dehydrogenase [Candidatus Omnitrophica bacterium]|nr:histidinol dehydrogenase [Candidatus Omnitrophota bacterium]
MKVIKFSSKQFSKLCERNNNRKKRVQESVRRIIEDVKLHGDDALIRYTRKFDKIKLTPRQLKVSESETSGAYQDISSDFVNTLKPIIENITRFYKKQVRKSWKITDSEGVILGEKYSPLDTVGVYVPSGTVPLVSSVYMTVLPAKLAGVRKVVLVTPPNKYCSINPHILVVANLLKVDEIYKVGGAQAIAALAFGTKTIPKVDKIVGPGNEYVTEAKRQMFGYADIDMVAGPSEVVIIANQHSNPDYVIADLRAQSEHFRGLSILITNSRKFAKQVREKVDRGYIILVKNLQEACEVTNIIAPEHLQIMVKSPRKVLKGIKNAGAIFIGPYTPTAVGDYIAGPSHVLPTGGTARFFSGLGLNDFMKSTHIISYSKRALERAREPIEKIAGIESLKAHLESIKVRFDEKEKQDDKTKEKEQGKKDN